MKTSLIALTLFGLFSANANAEMNTPELQTVSYSWRLDEQATLQFSPTAAEAKSKHYHLRFTGKELAEGIRIHTSSSNTFIQLSLLRDTETPTTKQAVFGLSSEAIQVHQVSENSKTLAISTELNSYGSDSMDYLALQLNSGAAFAEFELKMSANAPMQLRSQEYILAVRENDSPHTLALTSQQIHYFADDVVEISSQLQSNGLANTDAKLLIEKNQQELIAPDGTRFNLPTLGRFALGDVVPTEVIAMQEPGLLWEVRSYFEASLSDNKQAKIKREAKIALAINKRTIEVAKTPFMRGNVLQVPVVVQEASRFALTLSVFQESKGGKANPYLAIQQAQWLEPGMHLVEIDLTENLREHQTDSVLTLRDIELVDQTRLSSNGHYNMALSLERLAQK